MFYIAICDDEKYFRQNISNVVSKYVEEKQLECKIDCFSSGVEFLSREIEIIKYNIVFLDINMDELDGIETAKKIRELSKEIFIVFVTAYINYTLEGYKVDAVRYLLKDNVNLEKTINECMDAIMDKMNHDIVIKRFMFNEGDKDISLERIVYIESKLHKVEFHVMEKKINTYSLYDTLNRLEKMLEKYGFIRIHQSFLVNLIHIKNIVNYKAMLDNGASLAIPKVRFKSVKEKFVAYQGEV